MAIAYILYSQARNRFYIGSSRDNSIDMRLRRHNGGHVKSTKAGRPWVVVEIEPHKTYTEARKRELFLKSGVGRREITQKFGHFKQAQNILRRGTQVVEGDGLLNR